MKIRNYFFIVFVALSAISNAQTATSVANGSWTVPTTWDCMCIPTDGYTVTINHAVTMGNSWSVSSGSITINSGGSLTETGSGNGILVSGTGDITNHGTFTFSKLAVYAGTFTNTGIMNGFDSLYMGVSTTNTGYITTDACYALGDITNNESITANEFLNDGIFVNIQNAHFVNFFNNNSASNLGTIETIDFYNNGGMMNSSDIYVANDFTNAAYFYNTASALLQMLGNATNGDSVNHDAMLYNDGQVTIVQNFTNVDTLEGSGHVCVGELSSNVGYMDGAFEFCDNTPPAVSPFIDANTGFIGAGVTYCSGPCLSGIDENITQIIAVYPNPATDYVLVESQTEEYRWAIYDAAGRIVLNGNAEANQESLIDISMLKDGIYQMILVSNNSLKSAIIAVE